MRQRKKGQAALEFLTTYGWAFLVIIVMIGALAYFGVLSPERFIQEKCFGGTQWYCTDSAMIADSDSSGINLIQIEVKNMNDEAFNVTAINVSVDGDWNACSTVRFDDCVGGVLATNTQTYTWARKATNCIYAAGCGLTAGDTVNVEVTFDQYAASSSASYAKLHTVQATMKVQ